MGVDLYIKGNIPEFVGVLFPHFNIKQVAKAIVYKDRWQTQGQAWLRPGYDHYLWRKWQHHAARTGIPFDIDRPDWACLGRNSSVFDQMVARDDKRRKATYWQDKYNGYFFNNKVQALRLWSIECNWGIHSDHKLEDACKFLSEMYIM